MRRRLGFLLFALLAPLTLTGGFQCFYSSDPDDDFIFFDGDDKLTLVISARKQPQFVVEGLRVVFSNGESRTDNNGRVRVPGRHRGRIDFMLGDIFLGSTFDTDGQIAVERIETRGAGNNTATLNVVRLLLSLDRFRSDNRITIPAAVNERASLNDPAVAVYIETLDFSDSQAFASVASNLLALLTFDYPFTVELVDIATAREQI